MELRERVIVETYTGYCMTSPEEKDEVYKYMAEIMDRPVFTHELADEEIQEQLREKALNDFKALCITPEQWEKAYKDVCQLQLIYLSIGASGYFGVMFIDRLMSRYKKGERTFDLYESMIQAK